MFAWGLGSVREGEGGISKGLLGVMDMFIVLILVMASTLYPYVKTYEALRFLLAYLWVYLFFIEI